MRDHSNELLDVLAGDGVLTGSFTLRLSVDVFLGSDRVLEDIPVTQWSYDAVLDSEVNVSGVLTLVYQADDGVSIIPHGYEGLVTPFGASMYLSVDITAGTFTERIGLGWVEIVSIPSARDTYADTASGQIVTASVLEVEFASMDNRVRAWGFRFPEQPESLASVYDELRRITAMNVAETVADKSIPANIVYEPTEGGRLSAVQALFRVLGGMGVIDPLGAWTLVPYQWGSVVGTLSLGANGTVVNIPHSIDTDGVFNCVVGSFQDPVTLNPITAVSYVAGDEGLGVDSAWGEHTRYITDENVTTQVAASQRVAAELETVTQSQRYRVDVECMFNPLFELGDMVSVVGWVRPLEGRVIKYSLSEKMTMIVTLEVKRAL